MKAFHVTVIDRARNRTRYTAIARCWHEVWTQAADRFGVAALVVVRAA